MMVTTLLVLIGATLARGQRPFFAPKPVGFPVVTTTEGLGDRFGEIDGTTQRLPIEAGGDRDLVDRLSKLPIDKEPFWFINWQALEAHRKNPQTYPQKPNPFIDPIQSTNSSNTNFNSVNSNSGTSGSNPGNSSPISNSKVSAATIETTSEFVNSNRFGAEEYPRNQGSLFQDSIENSFTNSNPGSGHSNPDRRNTGSSEKRTSVRDHKLSQVY